MIKKMIILLIAVTIWISVSGCSSSKDEQMMNALDETVTGASSSGVGRTGDDTLTEMKHWKYSGSGTSQSGSLAAEGVQSASDVPLSGADQVSSNTYAPSDSEKLVTIQLITAEEMEQIMCELIDLGLMDKYATSQDEFQKAISGFQKENGLPVTGTLDSATLQILKK